MEISVVIPTYKRPDRICRAVQSAINQTVKEKEIIVVDDNGKDTDKQKETEKELETYIQNKDIIYLVNDVNSGGSFSRNQGLNIARGRYITFLDDDDEIDSTKLEKQIKLLDEKGKEYSASYTGYHKSLSETKIYRSSEIVEGSVYPYALSRSIYVGSGSNLVVRTDVARSIGGYDISFKRNQDLEFTARILKNYKLAYLDEDLMTVHYEIREVQRSYKDMVSVDTFYLDKFKEEIEKLPNYMQKGIYQTVALERFRYSLSRKELKDSMHNMKMNGVTVSVFIRYICYLIDRVVRKKSYGFKAFKI